jgi:type VII secretion protein EccE
LLSEADLRTRPLLVTPLLARPRPEPVERRPVPEKVTWTGPVRDYLRRLRPVQVICWQIAALAVVLTVRQPWPALVGTCVGAAALIALTGVRLRGRWLYELAGLAAAYTSRNRRRDLPENGGTPGMTLALLDLLLPGSTVRGMETSQGPATTISHEGGLTTQLRPHRVTPEIVHALPMPGALLPALADSAYSRAGRDHQFGVQLVLHVGVRPDQPRRLVVAVHAVRTVDTPADAELALALRNAARRVRRALGRAGVPVEPLPEEQALSAIAGLAHITGGRSEVREDWAFWRTGPVSQATFALDGWGALADSQARALASGLLAGIPGVAATVSLGAKTARRGDPVATAALRLAATTEAAVEAAATTITDRLAPSGVRLARLDGAHVHGVAASLPIGVFQQ